MRITLITFIPFDR